MTANELRVVGPPGTGKTTKLAEWIADAAAKRGPDRVLVTSLTRTAARELAARALPIPDDHVGTLHAVCYRRLGRPVIAESHVGDWNRHRPELALSAGAPDDDLDDLDLDRRGGTDGDRMMQAAQCLRARLIPRERWPDDAAGFQAEWDAWKRANGLVDFTELVERALVDARDGVAAPSNPEILFADEAQDSSPLELELLRTWAEQCDHVVFGLDLDQAIYEWRGATPDAFLDHPVPEANVRVLAQSYRVPRRVRDRAAAWIARCSRRFPSDYRARDEEGVVEHLSAVHVRPELAIDELERCHARGESAMVLATCGFFLDGTIRELRARGVPFHNPWRRRNGRWNPLRGGAERVADFLRPSRRAHGAHARLWTWEELRKWVDLVRAENLVRRGGKAYLDQQCSGSTREDRARKGARVTSEDLYDVFESEAAVEMHAAFVAGTELGWLARRLLATRARLVEYALRVATTRGAVALEERPHVVVGTVHSVKGGEASTVVIYPDLSTAGTREWWGDARGRDAVRRVFYVGQTRARRSLCLCAARDPQQAICWDA